MKNRLLAILLTVAILACIISGCSGSKNESPAETEATPAAAEASVEASTEESSSTVSTQEPAETAEMPEETLEEVAPAVVISYPVTEEIVTFTVSYSVFGFLRNFLPNGYTDSPFYEAFQEATGVAFEINEMGTDTFSEKMNLSIAAGDYADLCSGMVGMFTDADEAIEQEVVVDIMPYIKECMPDYYAAITAYEGAIATVTTESGKMGSIFEIYSTSSNYSAGYFIRDDYMEAAGYTQVPDTVEGFVDMLRAFKSNGVEYPLYCNDDGDTTATLQDIWYNNWGYPGFYWDTDSQSVKWCHDSDYTVEYWQWLNGLWNEGLYFSSATAQILGVDKSFNDYFKAGSVAVFTGKASTIDEELNSLNSFTSVTAIPIYTDGIHTENGELVSITGEAAMSVTTCCDEPELLMKALNYLYTEEGAFMQEYGTEGLSFNYNSAGEPEFSDLVMNNDVIPQRFAQSYYTNPSMPGLTDPYAAAYTWSEYARGASDVWESAYTGSSATFNAKLLTLNEAENQVINNYLTDFNTYIEENVYLMVYGETPITQENYDNLIATSYDAMHLQDILDAYTTAWLRYLDRAGLNS